jgi:hypothetical protein
MKQFIVVLSMLFVVSLASAQSLKTVTLISGVLTNNTIDTAYYDVGSQFDYLGINASADTAVAADFYVDARLGANTAWTTIVTDSLKGTTAASQRTMNLRSAVSEVLLWGTDNIRVRFSKRASLNGGTTKTYAFKVSGIKIRR